MGAYKNQPGNTVKKIWQFYCFVWTYNGNANISDRMWICTHILFLMFSS